MRTLWRAILRRFEFRRRVPGRPWYQILWYDFCESACRASFRLWYGLRIEGERHVPEEGPVVFVSNHQSFLDPILNGMPVVDRQLTAIARETLFRNRAFAWLLRSYGAIAIRDERGDAGAMRAALAELAAGRCVLIYPEGSRSDDGSIQEFKRGVGLLIKRAKVPVLPMAVDGAFDVWPPDRARPALRGRVGVRVGEPIPCDELLRDGIEAGLERLRREVESLRLGLRGEMRRASGGRWPLPGPTDEPYWARVAAPQSAAEAAGAPSPRAPADASDCAGDRA